MSPSRYRNLDGRESRFSLGRKSCEKKERRSREPSANSWAAGIDLSRVAAGYFDPERQSMFWFTNDLLINQIHRDGPRVAESFDRLCEQDLQGISEEYARALSLCGAGVSLEGPQVAVRVACAHLLMNALTSVSAATELLRSGYVLQPNIVLRSVVESVGVALHLLVRPRDLAKLQGGTLDAPKCVSTAKKILPFLGPLYGLLTSHFSHVSGLHQTQQSLLPFTERTEPLLLTLGHIRWTILCVSIAAEVSFIEIVTTPRFWTRKSETEFILSVPDKYSEWAGCHLGELAERAV